MPGLQPTARRPVEPCINCHLPSPPSYCVAHIMSFHPWHCHYTITRLNYLNAAVIILPPHPAGAGGTETEPSLPGCRAGSGACRAGRGSGQWLCHAGDARAGDAMRAGGLAGIRAARSAGAWRRGWVGRVFCGRDLLVMSGYQPPPSYRRFTGSPLEV